MKSWEDLFRTHILERGLNYYEEGYIFNVCTCIVYKYDVCTNFGSNDGRHGPGSSRWVGVCD